MMSGQERKAAERQARRRRIQRVARKLFADRGFQRTTIEDVARRAGLSVGAIYLYFKSKEELYVSLLQDNLLTLHKELVRVRRSEGTPRDHLQAAWRYAVRYAYQNPDAYRIFLFLSSPTLHDQVGDAVLAEVGGAANACISTMADLISAGVAAGIYPACDVQAQVDVLASSFLSLVLLHATRANMAAPAAPRPSANDTSGAGVDAGADDLEEAPPMAAPTGPIDLHAELVLATFEAGLMSAPRTARPAAAINAAAASAA